MPRVRGSKQENLVLKPHRPRQRVWYVAGLFLVVSVALVGSFVLGRQHEVELQALSPEQQQQLKEVKRKLTALERDRKVDQLALETSRKTIEELSAEISQLKKSVTFYRSIMEPGNAQSGLQVHDLGIEYLGKTRYRINWILAQVGKSKGVIQGAVKVSIQGQGAGEKRVLSLKEVAEDEMSNNFKFRYFQQFKAVVNMPEDFIVEKVEVVAESAGKNSMTATREFDWVTQETLADVGE